jgi:succinyl-CoA synthetase beta subunit
VNIFGGIMKCDVIAEGIVTALKQINITQPLVVRLAGYNERHWLYCLMFLYGITGTNVEKGKQIMAESGFNIITADDLDDAAQKAVQSLNQK